MKKYCLIIIFVSIGISMLIGALGSCSKDKDNKLIVGFSQVDNANPWRLAETESIKKEAEKRGVNLKYFDSQADQAKQIQSLRSFISQEVDAIILAPKVISGWVPVLQEAKDSGIPVVLVDRGIEVTDHSLYYTLIASDFVSQGEKAAKQMIADKGESLRVVELQGQPGADPTIDRKKGFENIINQYSGIEIILSQTGEFNRIKGKEVMEAFLKSQGKNIDVVYAHNDDMAIGAIQAIKEYGLNPGKDIYIVSIDGVRDAFKAMVAGELNTSVESTPLLGPYAFDAVEAVLSGESMQKWIQPQDAVFTTENASELIDTRLY